MKNYTLMSALVVCGWLAAAGSVLAHHAVAAQYDLDKPIEFSGTVVKMEFVNPHSMLHLEVTNPDGTKIKAFFPGHIIEKRDGVTILDLRIVETETGNLYVVMPVPASVRKAGATQ